MIFKVLILSLVFLFKDTNSENLINTNKLLKYNLVEGDINKFFKSLKKVCEKKLLQNLQRHPSYPSLGTANQWKLVCNNLKTKALNKSFLLQNFRFKELSDKVGILTGYYEPEIMVSFKKTKKFNIPLLKHNKKYDMLERKKIEANFKMEDVLVWTDNKIELFFLQIQGSGVGTLENKRQIKINYGGNNKKKYSSIGKFLKKKKTHQWRN